MRSLSRTERASSSANQQRVLPLRIHALGLPCRHKFPNRHKEGRTDRSISCR
jgi:hypothetical protein